MEQEFQALKKGKAEMAVSINCENLEVDDKRYVLRHTASFLSLPGFLMWEAGAKCEKKKMYLCLSSLTEHCGVVKMPSSSKA